MAKVRGSALIGAVKFLRTRKEEARLVLPTPLHAYLDECVDRGSWYPEAELLCLVRAILDLLPGHESEALEQMGIVTARAHLAGAYDELAQTEPSQRVLMVWSAMHDTGVLDVEREGPGRWRYELRDFALPSTEICAIVAAYLSEAHRCVGASDPQVEEIACRLRGDACCSWVCVE